MSETKPAVRYCKGDDGKSIAWMSIGSGPPTVVCQWGGALFAQTLRLPGTPTLSEDLRRGRTVVRYDGRGTGLSDRDFDDISIETVVKDVEAVVAAAGLDRFALFAAESSCHPAIHYAARHPERVTQLVLCSGFVQGFMVRNSPGRAARGEAVLAALETGLNDRNPGVRLMNLAHLYPNATPDELAALQEFQRTAFTGRQLARFQRSTATSDVSMLAPQVRCPTLVVHPSRDVRNPLEEGRRLATLIPGARFRPVDSDNYRPVPSDPAWQEAVREIQEFFDGDAQAGGQRAPFADLTPRQRDVLELLAQGLDNLQIAARLALAEKTVRNTITPIFEKLSVENRPQAIVRAREAGFGAAGRPG